MSGRPLEFVYLSCGRDTAVSLQAFWTYCEAHLYSHSPHFDILPIGALVPKELGWGGRFRIADVDRLMIEALLGADF